jgi:hypothetical protein
VPELVRMNPKKNDSRWREEEGEGKREHIIREKDA